MKIMNIICLLIWIFQFAYGISKIVNKEQIDPVIFLCAVGICIFYYLGEI